MAVNKNFVIKNGVEVAENLIFASSDLEKVGIGSTVPNDTLDVRGGIAATNFYAAGVVTSTDNFYVGASGTVFTALTGFGSVGVGTANPIFPLDIRSSASTGTTALYVYGDMRITGDIIADDISIDDVNATDLNVSGLSTLTGNVVLVGSVNQLNVSGISTFADDVIISGGGIQVTGVATFTDSIDANAGLDVDGQTDLDELVVAGVSTYSASVDINATVDIDGQLDVDELVVAGVSTFSNTVDINATVDIDGQLDVDELVVAGVSTFAAALDINKGADLVGGLTADNVNVTGVLTATSIYGAAQIGVASEGTYIGTGASVINFASTNGTAWTVTEASAGVVTATVTPGVSLGLAIALGG